MDEPDKSMILSFRYKALLAGIGSIIFLGLLMQLIFLLLATAYHVYLSEHPELSSIANVMVYVAATCAYFMVMVSGGYITAYFAREQVYKHCLLVSCAVIGLTLFSSIKSGYFTYMSLIFVISGIIFTLIGGRIRLKHNSDKSV